MPYPKMVYHKNYNWKDNSHGGESEKERAKASRLVRSKEEHEALGPDWYEPDHHPVRLEENPHLKAAAPEPEEPKHEEESFFPRKKKK